jgi:hypothetical protein
MPVRARRTLRKMRGGAQSHLIEADDGHCYVVKFSNNPQHRRILINEWLATAFLGYLQISAPAAAIVEIDAEFLQSNPETSIQLGNRSQSPNAGRHYGSRFPGNPDRVAVFDFLPDVLLTKVANLEEFGGVFVFDKWAGNSDARQSVYYRAKLGPGRDDRHSNTGFVALMVDHGYIFDGPNWTFIDSPLHGFYFRPHVYEHVRGWSDFEPWLERVRHFPVEVVDTALKQLPREWMPEEDAEIERLLEKLLARRRDVDRLIKDARDNRTDRFPNWR